jgi:hypothetical protein
LQVSLLLSARVGRPACGLCVEGGVGVPGVDGKITVAAQRGTENLWPVAECFFNSLGRYSTFRILVLSLN